MSEPSVLVPPVPTELSDSELAELGITRVAAEFFEVGPYRYSKLVDAIAQVQRQHRTASVG